jgi:hypothetical protein
MDILNRRETTAVLYGIGSGDRGSWAGRSRRHLPIPNTGGTIIGSACPPPIRERLPGQWRRSDYPASRASVAGSLRRQQRNHSCLVPPIARPATCGNRRVDPNGIRCGRPADTTRETTQAHGYSLIPAIPARPTSERESGKACVCQSPLSGRSGTGSSRSALSQGRTLMACPDSHGLTVLCRLLAERADFRAPPYEHHESGRDPSGRRPRGSEP